MIKPLRKQVLVELEDLVGLSKIIHEPDGFKAVSRKGKILAVGSQCDLFQQTDIGKGIVVEVVKGWGRIIPPRDSVNYGLNERWHVLAPEHKTLMTIE